MNGDDSRSNRDSSVQYRLGAIERRVDRLESLEPAVTNEKVSHLQSDIRELEAELKGVRRALWGFGLSVAGGAILFAATAWQAWGGG